MGVNGGREPQLREMKICVGHFFLGGGLAPGSRLFLGEGGLNFVVPSQIKGKNKLLINRFE